VVLAHVVRHSRAMTMTGSSVLFSQSLLKKDLAGIIGPSHPAYHQLLDEANRELQMAGVATGRRDSVASQVSEISREARQRRKSRKMAASSARTTASANSRPSAGFVPSFRGGRHRVPHSRLVREYQRQSRRMSMEGDASHHGEGSPTFVVHDPVGQDYIHQRLEEIQVRLCDGGGVTSNV